MFVMMCSFHQRSRGGSTIFMEGGGGAQNIMCARAHRERESRSPKVTTGASGPLKYPGSSWGVSMLFRII